MNASTRTPARTFVLSGDASVLTAIIIVAVVLRAAAGLVLGDTIIELPGIFDQVSYDTLARRVLAGAGFSFPIDWWPATRAGEPTAHWSFLYTSYLTIIYGLVGAHPLAGRLIQAVVAGVLCPLLAWRLGKRLFSSQVGLVAAAVTALYGYFIYYSVALVTESFFIIAVLWALDLTTMLATRVVAAQRAVRWWLLLGVVLGLAALLRQAVLLVVPVIFAWLIWARVMRERAVCGTQLRTTVVGLLLVTGVIVLLIAPWTVRNYQAFGRFVLLNTNAGYAFFWSNHPVQGTNFMPLLSNATYYELIPAELLNLDEASLDAALMSRGIQFVVDDPRRYVLLSVSRVRDYFEFWPSAASGPISNLTRVFSFGICLPFMVTGLVSSTAKRKDQSSAARHRARGVVLLASFAGVYSAMYILTWALIRYRLPVDAVLILFAAVGMVDVSRYVRQRFLIAGSSIGASVERTPGTAG